MNEKFMKKSKVTQRVYDVFSIVKIINPRQAAFYASCGLPIEDIEVSRDRKTGEPIFCFYFNKQDSKPHFDSWCSRFS